MILRLACSSLLLVGFGLLLSGCPSLVSYTTPTAKTPTLREARTLEEGQMGTQGSLAMGAASVEEAESQLFYQGLGGFRYGLTDSFELQTEVSFLHFERQHGELRAPDGERNLAINYGTAHLGVQYEIRPPIAVVLGVGGGGSQLGGFISADASVIVSYPNKHLIPILTFSGLVNAPVSTREVVGVEEPHDDVILTKETAIRACGWELLAGFRIPVALDRQNESLRLEVPMGVGFSALYSAEREDPQLSLFGTLGLEVVF